MLRFGSASLLVSAIAVLAYRASTPSTLVAADVKQVTDPRTGCQLTTGWAEIRYIHWSGECKNGKVHGYGEMEWYDDARLIWIDRFAEGSGLAIIEGDVRWAFEADDLRFEITNCDEYQTTYVSAYVPDSFNLSSGWLKTMLARDAGLFTGDDIEAFMVSKLPTGSFSGDSLSGGGEDRRTAARRFSNSESRTRA